VPGNRVDRNAKLRNTGLCPDRARDDQGNGYYAHSPDTTAMLELTPTDWRHTHQDTKPV